jgi:hypothetical protein
MAKVKGPAFSFEAHGTIGKSITFQSSRISDMVRFKPDQPNLKTPAQLSHRDSYRNSCACWQIQPNSGGAVPPDPGPRGRDWWLLDRKGRKISTFHFFLSQTIPIFDNGLTPDWCKLIVFTDNIDWYFNIWSTFVFSDNIDWYF